MDIYTRTHTRITGILIIMIIAMALGAGGCRRHEPAPAQYKDTRVLMGTTVTITLYGASEAELEQAADAAFAEIERLSAVFSRYDPESELSRLNREAVDGGTHEVSPEMAAMLARCVALCHATGGAFDITVGPLSAVWRQARESGEPPAETHIRNALGKMGCDKIRVNMETNTVTLTVPGMSLDLGGIAKGFITGRAARVIADRGVSSALINAGGDMTALGDKPGGAPWALGIQNPREPGDVLATISLRDAAVTTSGDYEQFFEKNGKRESHIIDPRTGHGAAETISATVIAPLAERADALSTALSVLGPDQGMAMLEKEFPGVEALIITPDRKLHYSPGFKQYLADAYQ